MTGLPLLPRVSVCLLTYNRACLLPRTIESLLAQSHGDFELLINDDRSTDGTEDVCRRYERLDSRVRYFRNARNLRYADNQNAAVVRAATEHVAIVHDGDVYRADLVEKWTRALVAHPTAALVFNALEQMDERGGTVCVYRHPYGPLVPGLELFDEMIRSSSSPIFGIVMVRRACVWAVGPFDPRLPVLADIDMWLRLLLRYDAAYIAEPLIKIAPREAGHQNSSTNWRVRRENELIYALASARRHPGDPAKVARLRREIAPIVWKKRLAAWSYCVRHGRWRAASEGVAFMARYLDFAADARELPADWAAARKRVEG